MWKNGVKRYELAFYLPKLGLAGSSHMSTVCCSSQFLSRIACVSFLGGLLGGGAQVGTFFWPSKDRVTRDASFKNKHF